MTTKIRYRIKIITKMDGSVEYWPQSKGVIEWGDLCIRWNGWNTKGFPCESREDALGYIDSHFSQKKRNTRQDIQFEYITKLL